VLRNEGQSCFYSSLYVIQQGLRCGAGGCIRLLCMDGDSVNERAKP